MKKISFLVISVLTCSIASAQFAAAPAANAKTMTTAEANKLNGTVQPTINGVPYSQYKAQQEALKAKQLTQSTTVKGAQFTTLPAVITEKPKGKD